MSSGALPKARFTTIENTHPIDVFFKSGAMIALLSTEHKNALNRV
jgi:hypothetical protein